MTKHPAAALIAAALILAASAVRAQEVPADTSKPGVKSAPSNPSDAAPPMEAPATPEASPAAEGGAQETPVTPALPAASKPKENGAARILDWEKNELGVSLEGTADARALQANLSGKSADLRDPTHENVDYTQAEIALLARPSDKTHGKLVFRIHQDWNNYYQEGPNPLLTRWFDYSGTTLGDHVEFNFGDFGERFSPLTLWSPQVHMLYEPENLESRRREALDEWHLGDDRLPLQGLHAKYSQDYSPALGLDAGFTGARLRSGGPSATTWLFWTDNVEKWLASGYAEARLFDAVSIGGTRITIYDPVGTARALNNEYVTVKNPTLPTTDYEDVNVNAFNAGFDAKRFLSNGAFTFRLNAEMAMSSYQHSVDAADSIGTYPQAQPSKDPTAPVGTVDTVQVTNWALKLVKDKEIDGKALRASLHLGMREDAKGPFGFTLDAAFLKNDADYVNDVAQSPSFIGTRIFNSRDSVGGFNRGYNTFDALYNHVYTVDPVTRQNTTEFWFQDTKSYWGTNNWYRAGDFKNSYTNSITTRSERMALMRRMDPSVQLLFPFGPATPNRQGLDATLVGKALEGKIEATFLFANLKEIQGAAIDSAGLEIATPATYQRIGAGAKVQAGEWLNLKHRITVSASYVSDSRDQPAFSVKDTAFATSKFTTGMLNAGLYAGLYKGLALLAGYQQIKSNPLLSYAGAGTSRAPDLGDLTESQWSAGLEYKIAHGAYVTAEYGVIAEKETKTGTDFSQGIGSLGLNVAF